MLGAALAASCGGGSTDDAAADDGAGGGAGSGASAGSSGTAGASGAAGKGSGGAAGAGAAGAAGKAGSSGASGSAGATGGAAGSGGSAGATGGAAGKGGSAGTAGAGGVTLTVSVAPAATTATVTLGVAPGPVTFKASAMQGSGAPMDVTAQSAWSLSGGSVGSVAAGVVTLSGTAGLSDVVATYAGSAGTAKLTVKLQGEAATPGVDLAKAGAQFAAAKPDASSAVPTLEYPLPGVLVPSNLPAIDAQWAKDGDSTLYRVKLVSSLVDLTVYTDKAELAFPDAIWTAFKKSTVDQPATIQVDGVGPKGLHAGKPQPIGVVSDPIPDSALYVWQNSTATFRVLDIVKGTDTLLPSDVPLGGSGTCVGCHRISRDGKRFSYTQTGPYLQVGTLAYDDTKKLFSSKAAPTASGFGTYAAFNPGEAGTRPAMLLTRPDYVPQNTAGNVTLEMVDPDTLAPVPSNAGAMLAKLPAAVGHHALMPDWSPAGDFVTFVAYDGAKHFVRDLGDDVTLGSLVEAKISYDAAAKAFVLGDPKVLVATPDADPDKGQNNFLPTISPDGAFVAFTRAKGWWSVKTQNTTATPLNTSGEIVIVRRSDQKVFTLAGGTSGPAGNWSSTWPQWAPAVGKKYVWVAYSTERPYGHLLTPANQKCALITGQQQCKQVWIMAVDLAKLSDPSGALDPSSAPFRIPGQALDIQAVSPQWTLPVLKQ